MALESDSLLLDACRGLLTRVENFLLFVGIISERLRKGICILGYCLSQQDE
jgi:hypothetical protein